MANGSPLPEGFVLEQPAAQQTTVALPEGFVLEQTEVVAPEGQETAMAQAQGGGIAQRIGQAFTGEQRMTPEMAQMPEIGAAPELNRMSVPAFKASLGLLATGETGSLKAIMQEQFGEDVSFREDMAGNTIVDLPSGSYALNKPGVSPQDVARTVFDVLAFTPAGRAATIPQAGIRSAATQAAIEGGEAVAGGGFDPMDIGLAGLFGTAAKGVERGAGALYRTLRGQPGMAQETVEAAAEAGIPTLTTDIVQPRTFAGRMAQQTGEKIPFAGTGGMRQAQQQLREEAVEKFTQKYGDFSYGTIVDSLKTQKNRVKNAAGSVMEATGRKLDDLGEIPTDRTRQAIEAVSGELEKKGVIPSKSAMDDLAVLTGALREGPQTFSSLKENRTLFREIVRGADKAERTQLTSRAKALLQRVENAMKQDMDDFAKKNLTAQEFNKWQKANRIYAGEAQKLTKTRLKNVLDKGDLQPEQVRNLLFSRAPSEVDMLYKSLTPEGRANARAAIINKVVDDLSRRQAGITPNTFATEMGKYGLQTNKFFKGEEKRALNGLLKALNATRRAQEAAVTTPTGQTVLGAGAGLSMWFDPTGTLGTAGTLGGLSRLYESAPVRNALLRLDSIPAGSTRFESALRELDEVMIPLIQTARERISERETPQ